MRDSLAEKIAELGLDGKGVLSPSQKAARVAERRASKTPEKTPGTPVRILATRIAGTSHIDNYEEVVDSLALQERLELRREPFNEADSRAVAILDKAGRRVGYIPQSDNKVVSELLDEGQSLYARVQDIDVHNRWAEISIDVYVEEQ